MNNVYKIEDFEAYKYFRELTLTQQAYMIEYYDAVLLQDIGSVVVTRDAVMQSEDMIKILKAIHNGTKQREINK